MGFKKESSDELILRPKLVNSSANFQIRILQRYDFKITGYLQSFKHLTAKAFERSAG